MDAILSPIVEVLMRFIAYIFVELIFGTICYSVGWCILKIFTLGKYPPKGDFSLGYNRNGSNTSCCIVGFIFIATVCISLLYLFG